MDDLKEKTAEVKNLVNKPLKIGSVRFTYTSMVGVFALISTIVGSLYGGFIIYQKVERLANLNLGAISSQMKKTSQDLERVNTNVESIQISLKKDMSDLRSGQWSLESKVDGKLQSIDSRLTGFETKLDGKLQSVDVKLTNYDTKLDRFEIKVQKTRDDLMDRVQESLDNPLAN